MSIRYRRIRPSKGDSAAAAVVSVAIGAGVAFGAFYLTRLFLAREPLAEGATERGRRGSAGKIARSLGDDVDRAIDSGGESNGGPTS